MKFHNFYGPQNPSLKTPAEKVSIYLSVCLSVSLSVCLPLSLSLYLSPSLYLSALSLSSPLSPLSLFLSLYIYIWWTYMHQIYIAIVSVFVPLLRISRLVQFHKKHESAK